MSVQSLIETWDLYPITDIQRAGGKSYPEIVEDLLSGGARVIQLRDKVTPFEELLRVGRELVYLTRDSGAQLIVNDNPYLAKEIGADGVHVGQHDCPPDLAREILGPGKIVGLSTHNPNQAIRAQMLDVDYIGWGPVFAPKSKESEYPELGLKLVEWAARTLKIPFVCIGGIDATNIAQVAAAGGKVCAVISAVMDQPQIGAAARELRDLMSIDDDHSSVG